MRTRATEPKAARPMTSATEVQPAEGAAWAAGDAPRVPLGAAATLAPSDTTMFRACAADALLLACVKGRTTDAKAMVDAERRACVKCVLAMKQFLVATGRAGTPERLTTPMARLVATMRQILDVTCSVDEFVEHVRVSFGRGLTTGRMTGDLRQRADTREATEALADVLERWIARDPLLSRVRGSPLPHAALRSPVRGSHPDRPGDTRPPPSSPVASPNERAAKRQRIAHSLGDGVAEALAAIAASPPAGRIRAGRSPSACPSPIAPPSTPSSTMTHEDNTPSGPRPPASPASVVVVEEETGRREPKYRVIGAARGLRVHV